MTDDLREITLVTYMRDSLSYLDNLLTKYINE